MTDTHESQAEASGVTPSNKRTRGDSVESAQTERGLSCPHPVVQNGLYGGE